MTTLTLIAEPFPDWEAEVQVAAARDLLNAICETAPRSCSAKYLIAKGTAEPHFASPKIQVEQLPMKASILPLLWQTGATARPLDGEFVHALTPLLPLRGRSADDASQTSVTVPHMLAFQNTAILGASHSRTYRNFVRRAVKYADVLLTPTHATARAIQQHYGANTPVQVLTLAPPTAFLVADDAQQRREALEVPELYALTTAMPGEFGRLEWAFNALKLDPSLPPLVVIEGFDPILTQQGGDAKGDSQGIEVPSALAGRVHIVRPRELQDIGALLDGAAVLLQPQSYTGSGYTLLGALAAGVPVLHSGDESAAELVLEAGVEAKTEGEFGAELSRLFRDVEELHRLSVFALDRSRGFSWTSTAWELWEAHANL